MKHEFTLKSSDKHKIPAMLLSTGRERLLIASHGITTNKTEDGIYIDFYDKFLYQSFDMLLFDFRGHGDSPFSSVRTTITGELLDFMTIYDWCKKQNYKFINHLATSFGASITLLGISAYNLNAISSVVFWNPVINYKNTFISSTVDWGHEIFDYSDINELAQKNVIKIPETKFYISSTMIQELLLLRPECVQWPKWLPLFILHGRDDTMVPCQDSQAYATDSLTAIQYKEISGVDHGFDEKLPQVMELTYNWLLTNPQF